MASAEPWWDEVTCAARAERATHRGTADGLRALVEVAEVLAGTLARVTLSRPPSLASVSATLLADRGPSDGTLAARPASPPRFRGCGLTRELETRIELVDADDGLVGDVQFVWTALSAEE